MHSGETNENLLIAKSEINQVMCQMDMFSVVESTRVEWFGFEYSSENWNILVSKKIFDRRHIYIYINDCI
jgi:hypothetical protein